MSPMCVVWRYGRSFSITDSTATCIMCVTHTFRNTAVATPGMCAWQPSSRAVATSDERVDSPCARMSADNSPVADAARSSACRTGRSSSKRTWRDVRKKDSQTHRSPLGTHTFDVRTSWVSSGALGEKKSSHYSVSQ